MGECDSVIGWPKELKILVAKEPVDCRKSIDGLSVKVMEQIKENPQAGHLFLFRNRANNKVKMLYWDRNGFMLMYKRLEKGRFCFPKVWAVETLVITEEQLQWLLAGFDFIRMSQFPELKFSNYC